MSEEARPVCRTCGQHVDSDNDKILDLDSGRIRYASTHMHPSRCITALRAALYQMTVERRVGDLLHAKTVAALDQERQAVRELAESPPLASISLCCGIVRPGHYAPDSMHHSLCRYQHHGELGRTYYLHDMSALLSGRGEGE